MRSKLSVLFVFICLIEAAGAQERKTMRGPIHGRVTDASGRPSRLSRTAKAREKLSDVRDV